MSDNNLYRHIPTGNLYQKLFDSMDADTKKSVVIYQSLNDKRIWVRDTEKFNERFEQVT